MSITSKILFSRGGTIAENKDTAIATLNKRLFFLGEPTILQYYNEKGVVETLFALGVQSGKGKDCYRLIYPEYYKLVNRVVVGEFAPDVSECIEGQVYLYHQTSATSNGWYLVSKVDSKRNIESVPLEPMMFFDLEKNMFYVSGDGDRIVRPLYDFYSKGEIDATVKELKDLIAAISGGSGADLTAIFERLDAIESRLDNVPDKDIIDEQISDLENNKVDKVDGKGLSTNDFTNEYKEKLDNAVSGEENVIEVIKVNGVALDVDVEKAVEIDLSGYVTKEEISEYVKTISVNGEIQPMDENGNVALTITGGQDERITDDMVAYLNSKLAYSYPSTATVTSVPSSSTITLPTTYTEVVFTATFTAKKKNESSETSIAVTNVTNVTTGWTAVEGTIDKYKKAVTILPTATTISSGSVSGSVTNADNKTSTSTSGSKTISFLKPWFIWEGTADEMSVDGVFNVDKASEVLTSLIDKTKSSKLTGTTGCTKTGEKVNIDTNGDVLWFAIPNTLSSVTATQLSLSILEDAFKTATTSLGVYKIYRTLQTLDSGEFKIDITIK